MHSLSVVFALAAAVSAAAQTAYPLEPSPVLELHGLHSTPDFSGYVSVRAVRRNDSSSFQVNRGRVTVTVAPRSFVALRLQGDFSSGVSGRLHSDSTTTGFTLTDAYVELAPPDSTTPGARLHPALVVGQFKQPYSVEYLTSFALLRTANRSQIVDRQPIKRDIGAMAQVSWWRWARLQGSLTQGEGANQTSNPDNHLLAIGRLTISPLPGFALAGKLANQGGDHASGIDGRFLWHHLLVEGETLDRTRPLTDTTSQRATGEYALASYHLRPWLEPVYKWETYHESTVGAIASGATRSTWNTLGLNLIVPPEVVKLEMDWIIKTVRPKSSANELQLQIVAIF